MKFPIIARNPKMAALTIMEILVSSTIMLFIVFGLMMMFNQTQRAFKSSLRQVDVLEGGRSIMELLVRDFEQLSATAHSNVTTFYASVDPAKGVDQYEGSNLVNENLQSDCFVLWPENLTWHGVAYTTTNDGRGLATLFRAEITTSHYLVNSPEDSLYKEFDQKKLTYYRVASGITHFLVRPLAKNGSNYWVDFSNPISFTNDLPQYLEIELGILEPETIERAKAIPDDNAARDFLKQQAGKTHLFRQQVPIRTAQR